MEALYVTGGGSELPLVARMLREEFGRRVRRSTYTRSATAIGLAIQADASSGYALRDVFSRNFGVWREGEAGRRMTFDVIFPCGTPLPGPGEPPLTVRRIYQPVHNIGHLRYLEASSVDGSGQPAGDIAVWDEVLFPWTRPWPHTSTSSVPRWSPPRRRPASRSRSTTPAMGMAPSR